MTGRIRRRGIALIVCALALIWVVAPMNAASAAQALAAASAPASATGDRLVQFSGERIAGERAVLLVHGWLSTSLPLEDPASDLAESPFARPIVWQDASGVRLERGRTASLHERLAASPGVALYAFDYSANSAGWVGSTGTSDRLADAIRDVAASVDGPVDIVAHSMGGIALRYALEASPDLAGLIGRVVTVGTPSEGSDMANLAIDIAMAIRSTMSGMPLVQSVLLPAIGFTCNAELRQDARGGCDLPPVVRTGIAALGEGGAALRAGSPQLANLPDWPADVTVHAISGSAVISLPLAGGRSFDIRMGDGLVSEQSAIADADIATVVTCRTTLAPGAAGVLELFSGTVDAPPFGGACGHDIIFTNLDVVNAVMSALSLGDVAPRPDRLGAGRGR